MEWSWDGIVPSRRTEIGACVARDCLGQWLGVAETGEGAVGELGEVGGQGEAGG